jgi:serine/threonine protein phosphatase PrpC
MAVADGHGSEKAFRSDRGSKIAVDVMVKRLQQLAEGVRSGDLSLDEYARDELPQQIVAEWKRRVDENLRGEPLTEDEFTIMGTKLRPNENPATVIQKIKDHPESAYGSTVLGATIIDSKYLVLLQLGDGDIVVVNSDHTTNKPITEDPRHIGDLTTSLSGGDAGDMRVIVMEIDPNNPPSTVQLSTDGLSNSFEEAGFLKFATDVDAMDNATVNSQLEGWLRHYSDRASGDDITCGLLRTTSNGAPPPIKDVGERDEVEAVRLAHAVARETREQGMGFLHGKFPPRLEKWEPGAPEAGFQDISGFDRGRDVTQSDRLSSFNDFFGVNVFDSQGQPHGRQSLIIAPFGLQITTPDNAYSTSRKAIDASQENWTQYSYSMPIINQRATRGGAFVAMNVAVPPSITERIDAMMDPASPNYDPTFMDKYFKALYPGYVGDDASEYIKRRPATELMIKDFRMPDGSIYSGRSHGVEPQIVQYPQEIPF